MLNYRLRGFWSFLYATFTVLLAFIFLNPVVLYTHVQTYAPGIWALTGFSGY